MSPQDTRNGYVACTRCGEKVAEDEATYNSGSVKEDGAERLASGEEVGIDELFGFDEPYCSMDCLIAGDNDE
jgi:hypothetical protein